MNKVGAWSSMLLSCILGLKYALMRGLKPYPRCREWSKDLKCGWARYLRLHWQGTSLREQERSDDEKSPRSKHPKTVSRVGLKMKMASSPKQREVL